MIFSEKIYILIFILYTSNLSNGFIWKYYLYYYLY